MRTSSRPWTTAAPSSVASLLCPSPPSPTAAAPSSVALAVEETTVVTDPALVKAVVAARRGKSLNIGKSLSLF